MSQMIEAALQYAARGWLIFPLSAKKVPFAGSHGHLDATSESSTIERWWTERPGANIGLATGAIVVLDADGPGGIAQLQTLKHLPSTLAARTPRGGLHLFYRAPAGMEIRTRHQKRKRTGDDGLDTKGSGGYVVLPPSRGRSGAYQWLNCLPIADMPAGLVAWYQEAGGARTATVPILPKADIPAYLTVSARPAVVSALIGPGGALGTVWTAHEEARVAAALRYLRADGYDQWVMCGMALHGLGWARPDGTDRGLELWDEWSQTCPDKYAQAALETKWLSFGRNSGNGAGGGARATVGIGSVYLAARVAGWDGAVLAREERAMPEAPKVSEINGNHALPAVFAQPAQNSLVFPDTNRAGQPTATCTNTSVALRMLGVACRHDRFHDRLLLAGEPIDQWAGELGDHAVTMLRVVVRRAFGFDPGPQHAHDAAVQECLQHGFDPVLDYLDAIAWDGRSRLAGWLSTYLGAEPSGLNSAIGALALVAAVRRARVPGAKFDQIVVLESPEGRGKSSAIEIMAGSENYSEQTILTLDDKGQQEAVRGVWLYEIADLAGMHKADVEKVKAFASRKVDRARPAYGRSRIDRPRRCVFIATTNDMTYLKAQTGNRRFWPVRCGRVDLDALGRDRDQLWAEASEIERCGVPLSLAERFWGDASALQESRRDHDPWDDILAEAKGAEFVRPDGTGRQEWRISTKDILDLWLRLPTEKQTDATAKRVSHVMGRLGWEGPKTYRDDKSVLRRGYTKAVLL